MNNLTRALLTGAALCALGAVPAIAGTAPILHITALHGGRVINKTKLHNRGATHLTYTFGVYAYVPSSTPVHTKLTLSREKVCWKSLKVSKPFKTQYARVSMDVQTYSTGCQIVSTIYKTLKPLDQGGTDTFTTFVSGKFKQNGTKYKGTLNLDNNVIFE